MLILLSETRETLEHFSNIIIMLVMAQEENIEQHDIFNLKPSLSIMHSKISASEVKSEVTVPPLSLDEQFKIQQQKWGQIIIDMSKKLVSMSTITDLMVDVANNRQSVLDDKQFYLNQKARMDSHIKRMTLEKQNTIALTSDRKLTKEDKAALLEAELADVMEMYQKVNDQITFLHETMKTIDNLAFFVKNRLSINEYQKNV